MGFDDCCVVFVYGWDEGVGILFLVVDCIGDGGIIGGGEMVVWVYGWVVVVLYDQFFDVID